MPNKCMAPLKRLRIPQTVTDEVLFASDHTCCVCRTPHKDVQLHHIDRNRRNNDPGNLAVVCLDCHSNVSGHRGLGKSYSIGEVRRCKRNWEHSVQEARGIRRPRVAYKKELFSQVDLIICEILSLPSNSDRIPQLLGLLYELHLWRGSPDLNRVIVQGLNHLSVMSGLSSPRVASLVADKLWQLCWHFVGPDRVPMNQADEREVLKCVRTLETLATFNAEFGHGRKAMESAVRSAENFFDVSLWYRRRALAGAVLRLYEEATKGCCQDGKVDFRFAYVRLRKSLRKLRVQLVEWRPRWKPEMRRIDSLLK